MWNPHQTLLPDYKDVVQGGLKEGGLLKPNFSGKITNGLGDEVLWVNNGSGFRNEYETPFKAPEGVKRILSLGDSFAAGYRVGQTETYSFIIEKRLNKEHPTNVLISMIEQPVIGLKYLKKFGYKYEPDSVLLGLTLGNDLAQTYAHPKGSLSQVLIPPSCLKHDPASDVMWGLRYTLNHSRTLQLLGWQSGAIISNYGSVYEPKAFDMSHGLGFFLKNPMPEIEAAYESVFQNLLEYQQFLNEHDTQFLVLLFPQRFQVQQKDWEDTVLEYALKKSCFDLNLPNNRIINFCKQNDLQCIDPTSQMRKSYEESGTGYYLPLGDMHWNAQGHRAFTNAIWEQISLEMKKKLFP